jgi:hypothetical protein
VVECGVTDEDHVRRLQLFRLNRRTRVLAQKGVDQDAVRRADDLVARRTEER